MMTSWPDLSVSVIKDETISKVRCRPFISFNVVLSSLNEISKHAADVFLTARQFSIHMLMPNLTSALVMSLTFQIKSRAREEKIHRVARTLQKWSEIRR